MSSEDHFCGAFVFIFKLESQTHPSFKYSLCLSLENESYIVWNNLRLSLWKAFSLLDKLADDYDLHILNTELMDAHWCLWNASSLIHFGKHCPHKWRLTLGQWDHFNNTDNSGSLINQTASRARLSSLRDDGLCWDRASGGATVWQAE